MAVSQNIQREVRELQLVSSDRFLLNHFHGNSMLPFLQEGDLAIVNKVDASKIKLGDVIVFRDRDLYTTRRIIQIQQHGTRLRTKADNWPNFEYYFSMDDVLGKLVSFERDGKTRTHTDLSWRVRAMYIVTRERLRSGIGKFNKKAKGLFQR